MPRTPVTSPTAASVGPDSHAIVDGQQVFLSGQTPVDPATGELHTGGVGEQTHDAHREHGLTYLSPGSSV